MAEKESEGSGTIESIVLVTIPAALIYFIGWTYLYYYLGAFSIDLSELDFDVETVLIYAAPPIFSLCSNHWALTGLFLLVLALASVWLLRRIRRHNKNAASATGAHVSPTSGAEPLLHVPALVLKGVWALVIMVCLASTLRPAIKEVALAKAAVAWRNDSVAIEAVVEEPEKADPLHVVYEDYKTCVLARNLHIIFSDKERYFMLCISDDDPDPRALFEVRREDSALASVRYVPRPEK